MEGSRRGVVGVKQMRLSERTSGASASASGRGRKFKVFTTEATSRDDQFSKPLIMPDVGLTTAQEPLPAEAKIIIKYSVEVEGLPVYQETYDVDKLAAELAADRSQFKELWLRRVECVVKCRQREAFSASLTGCLAEGTR
jgi:hypothetical protein